MKKLLSAFVLLLFYYSSHAQSKNYQAVFDVSIKDSITQQAVIRELGLIKNASPDASLEAVIYGQGLNLVLKDKSAHAGEIMKLINTNHVAFKVCGMTLSRNHVDKSALIPGVEVVPDGIYEIVSKQKEGWGYIKAAQ
jgi:intracellular sulfur oxidation DsrE/DsrF family protein